MARPSKQDRLIRTRWKNFLAGLVGKGAQVSIVALERALQKIENRESDARAEIYAYLAGKQAVGAAKAFSIGQALRDCGVDWMSGPVALFGAGHLRAFVGTIAAMAERGDEVRAARTFYGVGALSGLFRAAKLEKVHAQAFTGGISLPGNVGISFSKAFAESQGQARSIAQSELRLVTTDGEDSHLWAAWRSWSDRRTTRGLHAAFRVAVGAVETGAPIAAAEEAVYVVVDRLWASQHNNIAVRSIARKLRHMTIAASVADVAAAAPGDVTGFPQVLGVFELPQIQRGGTTEI